MGRALLWTLVISGATNLLAALFCWSRGASTLASFGNHLMGGGLVLALLAARLLLRRALDTGRVYTRDRPLPWAGILVAAAVLTSGSGYGLTVLYPSPSPYAPSPSSRAPAMAEPTRIT